MPSDSGGPRRGQPRAFRVQENQELPYFGAILRHLSVFTDFDVFACQPLDLSSQQRRRSDPRHHAPKQPPRQMTFRQ